MNFVILTLMAIVIFYFFRKANKNTHDVVINTIKIDASTKYVPTMKILQLSDLHLEKISINPEQLYQKLKNEQFDLIAITGDFLDTKKTIPQVIPYLEVMNKLNAKHGIYVVLGNHDYLLRKNLTDLTTILEKYQCKVLKNENEMIVVHGKPVNLIGIDDFHTRRSDVEKSYKGVQVGTNLVLTHDPNVVLHMKNYHFDYLLSGHFHGGQICYPKAFHLLKMGKLPRMNMIKGLHSYDGKPFYINEGLGQTSINIRVGSRPEITIHEMPLETIATAEKIVI